MLTKILFYSRGRQLKIKSPTTESRNEKETREEENAKTDRKNGLLILKDGKMMGINKKQMEKFFEVNALKNHTLKMALFFFKLSKNGARET